MLKPFMLVSAAILFVFAATPTLGHMPPQAASSPSGANSGKPAADSLARAKKIYGVDCSMCHNDNGDGKSDLATSMQLTMPNFADPKALESKTDQDLFKTIRAGVTQGDKVLMPPEDAGRAKDDDVRNLIVYIRSFSKGQPAAPSN